MSLRYFVVAAAVCVSLSAFAWDPQGGEQSPQQRELERDARLSHTQDETIRDAQQQLAAQGYDPGPADGKLGPRTMRQIVKFQEDHELQASGDLDDQTLAALHGQTSSGSSSVGSSSAGSSSKPLSGY